MENYVITIARGYGSGGRTIGKMLSEELNIPYYDRELLRLASDESGINEELFGKADENLKKSLLYKIARKEYKGELIPPDREDFVSNDNLFTYQAKVIKDLAAEGPCVIIGRCADYVLKDQPNVVRLYIHAPLKDCIERVRGILHGNDKELEKQILAIDKRRAAYYKYYTGHEWTDAGNYDLCLNTGHMDYETCVKITKSFLEIIPERV
ncbi:MAG: cytidylate kinase-like family protein [Lachnospiraceae bacterium]|nr:cytidylate kinase-like family protein [Lachnospiraceae bacterium]